MSANYRSVVVVGIRRVCYTTMSETIHFQGNCNCGRIYKQTHWKIFEQLKTKSHNIEKKVSSGGELENLCL